MSSNENKFQFAIDRGGTFTDVWSKSPSGKIRVMKLLSEDPSNYKDAPFEAIRRIIEIENDKPIDKSEKIDPSCIDWIRMGTTVATNALLERKGETSALLINKGFRDLLFIGNQSRPNIFDLKIRCPEVLYKQVVEVEERVILAKPDCSLNDKGTLKSCITEDKVHVMTPLNEEKLRIDLQQVLDSGVTSLAVILAHSYIFPDHELRIGEIAKEMGFNQISLSSQVIPMIKMVPRGLTVSADAYLTPGIQRYVSGFADGFVNHLNDLHVLFMQSDGGLTPVANFHGSRAIVSGPAGGVIGYALTTYNNITKQPVVGFDMGGTSTDVSRYGGSLEHVFESFTAGVSIQAPQLDINTVAAGGGSRLFFRSGLFVVGPESAGSHPGPVCYRKRGHLTITDANLLLGRLLPEYFPKIFGSSEDQPLDYEATKSEFEKLTSEVNEFIQSESSSNSAQKPMTLEEVAMGFIRVANETMCRPIRALTQAKGYDTSKHILACFGGAGGQHACSIARNLGMKTVYIHKYAGILSAYGMALADVVEESQEPCHLPYASENMKHIRQRFRILMDASSENLLKGGFTHDNIENETFLHLRYEGTDCALMCPSNIPYSEENFDKFYQGFGDVFLDRYRTEFGFVLSDRPIIIDDIRVRGLGHTEVQLKQPIERSNAPPIPCDNSRVYFEDGWLETPLFQLHQLKATQQILGPAIIIDKTSTILVEPDCTASITDEGDIEIILGNLKSKDIGTDLDPIQLSIFSHRFMSTAEQMGRILQRTAISTNIKERLDFSCALFGPDGGLVANAPHIPVHLGAMQETVQYQMRACKGNFKPGDVILSNHPSSGGSHLPDLTVITPVFYKEIKTPVFFLANRGHHADIGGSTPGSMPPHSKSIFEEGAVFKTFYLLKEGVLQEEALVEALNDPAKYPGCSGTRNLSENLSDLKAQVAANQKGIQLVCELIDEYGLEVVQAYMDYIQSNAEIAVRDMLKEIAQRHNSPHGTACYLEAHDFMDDGSVIQLKVRIEKESGTAEFDFSGTSAQVSGNTNTPRAVTQSCLIYCLRCMVGHDVPLNQGCLKPIKTIVPPGSLLDPSEDSAVVGGNVLTSQRIVDVIFHAFESCAASQGCMNNVTFGDDKVGYYETVAGGAGAGPSWHGRSGIHSHMTNTRITDLEILERRYPVVLQRFSLADGTGGDGQFQGGDGVIRELLFRRPLTLSVLSERRVYQPYGLHGGSPGNLGVNLLIENGGKENEKVTNLGGKLSVNVKPGDIFSLKTPGGGGYGLPGEQSVKPMQEKCQISIQKGSVHDYQMAQYSA